LCASSPWGARSPWPTSSYRSTAVTSVLRAPALTVFSFNARELDQNPGRYHPPIFTLNADGTGQLVNANNMSIFPNPPPPAGSGLLVDVNVGDEYDVDLTFDTSLTIAAPIPIPPALLLFALPVAALLRLRNKGVRFI
jgi:hypothetical protein